MTALARDRMTARAGAPYVPILLYHSVADAASGWLAPFTISPSKFASHMAYLADNGYRTLSVDELAVISADPTRQLPDRAVLVTFDDGFANFGTVAWPAIRRHGLSATLYMVSGHVGGTSEWLADRLAMLSWRGLGDLAADGCEIGAHTEHHIPLDVVAPDRAAVEIRASKDVLEDGLGRAVTTFAYPFGHHNRAVRALAVAAGFRTACAVKNRLSTLPDDRFALARVTITADTGTAELAGIVRGEGVARVEPGERWRTTGYRWVRRAKHRRAQRNQHHNGGEMNITSAEAET